MELDGISFSNDGEVFVVKRANEGIEPRSVDDRAGRARKLYPVPTGYQGTVQSAALRVYTGDTGDHRLREINRNDRQSALVTYGGATINLWGEVII